MKDNQLNDEYHTKEINDDENNDPEERLVDLIDILLYKQEKKHLCKCTNEHDLFDYKGYGNVLGGKVYFTPKRFRMFEIV